MASTLNSLKLKYAAFKYRNIKGLYSHYVKQRQAALVDSIAAAAAIGVIFESDNINLEAITPQMEEAFQMSFPQLDFLDLEGMSDEQLQGIISSWKGKVFEMEVADKLNNGELVGDIQLEDGQYAEIAEQLNQPGWDLQIFNGDGTVAEQLQLKATESLGYINDTIEKYPDIGIISTEEIANIHPDLIDSGISNIELTESISTPLSDIMDSAAENVLEAVIPGLPIAVIGLSEGYNFLKGKQTSSVALKNAGSRGLKTGAAMAAGWTIAAVTGSGLIAAPVVMGGRYFFDLRKGNKDSIKMLENHTQKLLPIAGRYK